MFSLQIENYSLKPALIVIDMQNGFVSEGGSYHQLNMDTSHYREIIPTIKKLINLCRDLDIPIFYTEAVREPSGIDLLTKTHKILPMAREERLTKIPICVRGTWDAATIDEIKPTNQDHVIIKRRDSAFQDTELEVWLESLGINTIILCGVDTSICVETSLREGFNEGYDVILVSDATASGNREHYLTTLQRVKDYYGIVTTYDQLKKFSEIVERNQGQVSKEHINSIFKLHRLLDTIM